MSYPSMPEFVEYVKIYSKRVGLRLIYKKFQIPEGQVRLKFKELWDEVELEVKGPKEAVEPVSGKVDEPVWTDEEEKTVDPFAPSQEKITDPPVKKKQEERPDDDKDSEDLTE